MMIRRGLLGSGFLVATGVVVGRLSDLGERAGWELAESKRVEEEIKHRGEELEALWEISLAVTAQLELDELLQNVVERGCRLLDVRAGGVYLVDEERGDLELVVSHGYTRDYTSARLAPGEGIAGRVLQNSAPLVVDDYRRWEGRALDWEAEPLTAVLGVPLKRGEQIIGVLDFSEISRAKSFDEHDVWLTTLFANQVAIAIENARLYQEAQQRATQLAEKARCLEAVYRVSSLASSSLELDRILNTVAEQMVRLFGVGHSGVLLFDRARVYWQMVAEYPSAGATARRGPVQRYLTVERIIADPAPLVIEDAWHDPLTAAGRETMRQLDIRSMLIVSLVVKGEVVGSIGLDAIGKPRRFSAEEIDLAQSIANQVAVSIGNARLYEELEKAKEDLEKQNVRLETLYHVGQMVNSTLEIDAILDHLTDEAMRVTRVTHGQVLVVRYETSCFERRSLRGFSPQEAEQARTVPLALNQGINGRAYITRQAVRVDDVRTEPAYFPLIPATRTELAVPIIRDGLVLGNLDLQSPEVGAFRDVDLDYLNALADQVAVALANARMYEETRRHAVELEQRAQRLALLNRISTAVNSTLDLDEILQTTVDEMAGAFNVTQAGVVLFDRQLGYGRVMAQYQQVPDGTAEKARFLLRGNLSMERILATRQPLAILDARNDPLLASIMDVVDLRGVESILIVPLLAKGQVIGIIGLDATEAPRTFTPEETELAQTIANQAAIAIENARLYEQAQHELAERKRAEAALEAERASLARRVAERTAELSAANAELARAARAKDEFLASMSHELRTPLSAILGLSEALQEQVYGPLNERHLKSLRSIEEGGRHLLALINDILDVSKIEAGKVELEIGPVTVEPVCRASLGLIKQIAHEKRLKVSSSFDSAVATIQTDARRLKQILVNLLSNAIKFTPEGGTVGLEVVGDAEGQVVHFTVWDTGIGISEKDMARLFQPFLQLDSSLSREHAGTGLGLALVHRLAEMHGGGVSLESHVGQGSRFTVSLPWQPTGDKVTRRQGDEGRVSLSPPLPVSLSSPPPAPLILLAEDNEANIDTISDYLLARGYRVVVARDGIEAIGRAREERPDLILMDIQMPGMDGLEATRRIRADADPSTGLRTSLAEVPIVALTALAMSGDRERCLEAGVNEYLSKPVSLKELVETVETQLGRNQ